jgi:F-type H+-transporting ATPase subunit b
MFEFDPEFWVAVSFLIFMGILVYVGAHRKIAAALDDRRARIAAELDEARRLREEAAALLGEYRRRQQQAEAEAEQIVAAANAEAERMAVEARAKLDEFVARRTKMAETKIAQAEAQAMADVRAAATEAAVAAAEKILTQAAKGKLAEDLLASGIEDVKKKLN